MSTTRHWQSSAPVPKRRGYGYAGHKPRTSSRSRHAPRRSDSRQAVRDKPPSSASQKRFWQSGNVGKFNSLMQYSAARREKPGSAMPVLFPEPDGELDTEIESQVALALGTSTKDVSSGRYNSTPSGLDVDDEGGGDLVATSPPRPLRDSPSPQPLQPRNFGRILSQNHRRLVASAARSERRWRQQQPALSQLRKAQRGHERQMAADEVGAGGGRALPHTRSAPSLAAGSHTDAAGRLRGKTAAQSRSDLLRVVLQSDEGGAEDGSMSPPDHRGSQVLCEGHGPLMLMNRKARPRSKSHSNNQAPTSLAQRHAAATRAARDAVEKANGGRPASSPTSRKASRSPPPPATGMQSPIRMPRPLEDCASTPDRTPSPLFTQGVAANRHGYGNRPPSPIGSFGFLTSPTPLDVPAGQAQAEVESPSHRGGVAVKTIALAPDINALSPASPDTSPQRKPVAIPVTDSPFTGAGLGVAGKGTSLKGRDRGRSKAAKPAESPIARKREIKQSNPSKGQFVYRPFRNSAQREAERNAVAPRRGSELWVHDSVTGWGGEESDGSRSDTEVQAFAGFTGFSGEGSHRQLVHSPLLGGSPGRLGAGSRGDELEVSTDNDVGEDSFIAELEAMSVGHGDEEEGDDVPEEHPAAAEGTTTPGSEDKGEEVVHPAPSPWQQDVPENVESKEERKERAGDEVSPPNPTPDSALAEEGKQQDEQEGKQHDEPLAPQPAQEDPAEPEQVKSEDGSSDWSEDDWHKDFDDY